MRKGGESDPRNKSLMKMFNLINIGERLGSGVPLIFNIWEDYGWKEPIIEERFDPDPTILLLELVEKQVNICKIYLEKNREAKTRDIAAYIGLSMPRTRAILSEMKNVEPTGRTAGRKYRLKR